MIITTCFNISRAYMYTKDDSYMYTKDDSYMYMYMYSMIDIMLIRERFFLPVVFSVEIKDEIHFDP